MMSGIHCWPNGHGGGECEETIPDHEHETLAAWGWGFVTARDDGMESGIGQFYACPEHRDDVTPEQREGARKRNTAMKRAARAADDGG